MLKDDRPEPGAGANHRGGTAVFVYEVDGEPYEHDRPRISGEQIMADVGIPISDGLVQLLPDGTAVTINPEDEVKLVPRPQFKRRPRFKRG